ncbi:MAG: hypothetical protein FWG73_06450 [Planctomycetaceae bacterium]|nr:hypothetical protein [Planctomycetaceae bacterium]
MAESYFDWLTEQQGLPAKPFDALEELKQLRRKLAARIQTSEFSATDTPVLPAKIETNDEPDTQTEDASLDSALNAVANMKQTLAACQQSSQRIKPQCSNLFRGRESQAEENADERTQSPIVLPAAVSQELNVPQDSMLETINAGLMALGIIGVVFGLLSFYRGWESDLSFGTLASASGAAIVAVGFCGRLLASGEPDRER